MSISIEVIGCPLWIFNQFNRGQRINSSKIPTLQSEIANPEDRKSMVSITKRKGNIKIQNPTQRTA